MPKVRHISSSFLWTKSVFEQLSVILWAITEHCCLALGSFEAAFSGLPNIKAIDIGSTKVNCKRVLELLPSMLWAAELEKLGLASTNAEGKRLAPFFADQSPIEQVSAIVIFAR